MQWTLPISILSPQKKISYSDNILLAGSCFTEHIGNGLKDIKFRVEQNPHGILFGVDAICQALEDYIANRVYTPDDLFFLNGLWYSWNHHSKFAATDPADALDTINDSIQRTHAFLQKTNYLVLTLGSSFCYQLTEQALLGSKNVGESVANCHRAPAAWFTKKLLTVSEMVSRLTRCITLLHSINPSIQLIFTVSPVRHIRDGVQENNRSKARLFETIQQLEENNIQLYYFPAYEIVIDVLRDYRFYDIDLVHPNFAATEYVIEKFMQNCVDEESVVLAQQLKKLRIAFRHRSQHAATSQHQQFLLQQLQIAQTLQSRYPTLDFSEEIKHFTVSN
jgi:hypothetical protein